MCPPALGPAAMRGPPGSDGWTPWLSALVAWAVAACPAAASRGHLLAALVRVSPAHLGGASLGFLADFSADPSGGALATWAPKGNEDGCLPYEGAPEGRLALVRRGACAFAQKALNAQAAGAAGLLVVWDSDQVQPLRGENASDEGVSIAVVAVREALGNRILAWNAAHPGDAAEVSLARYAPPACDLSEALVVLLAASLVALGAFVATADLRPGSPLAPRHNEEVLEMTKALAFGFCLMGSAFLTLLYFCPAYQLVVLSFCVGSASATSVLGSAMLSWLLPSLSRKAGHVPTFGEVSRAEVVGAVLALSLVGGWLALRRTSWGWLFQDALGAATLCMMQRSVRLPSMKVATLLLLLMFFYDIFWVFLSPLFFKKSVMVHVATGGGTGVVMPMLLRVPAILDPLGGERMLGFGDVMLPGLLASYLLRRDALQGRGLRDGCFAPALAGYTAGLCVSMLAVIVARGAQPALLYLLPSTLGAAFAAAWSRGELADLWNSEHFGRKAALD